METQIIALLIFLGLATGVAAVGMFARDVALSVAAGVVGPRPIRLRRMPRPDTNDAPQGFAGRFDGWFAQLVQETGWGWTPMTGALLVGLSALLAGGAAFIWTDHPVAASAAGVIAAGLTIVVLTVRRVRHIGLLQKQFPPALEFIARSVRAGHSLDEAIAMAGQEGPKPLAAEFAFCARQIEMGLGVPAAVRSLAERVRLVDVRIFAALLGIHREAGGNVAGVLEQLALSIRDRMSYRRQLRAITSAGRLSAFFVAALAPIIFVYMYFFHSEYAHTLIESSMGQMFLAAAVVLQIIGLTWTARLMKPMY
ncbi:MAG: type II secretion system F family protein [Thermoguttaceae bacterium]|nr:type II secretion system F family protein [Thermoguttaceae bacterium]